MLQWGHPKSKTVPGSFVCSSFICTKQIGKISSDMSGALFRWGTHRVPHLYMLLCVSVCLWLDKNCQLPGMSLQTSTEARLAPGVDYKQLSIVHLGPNPVPPLLCKVAIFLNVSLFCI